jgi:hypothetical protein
MSVRDFADLYLDRLSLESPTAITHDLSVLPSFPVFSSPTATVEVVGNTGKLGSEKAGVGGSLATIIPKHVRGELVPEIRDAQP